MNQRPTPPAEARGTSRHSCLRLALAVLAPWLSLLGAVPGGAALAAGLPGPLSLIAAPAASEASAPLPPSADAWRARLDRARQENDRLRALPDGSEPLLADRKLASGRRLALLAEQVEANREPAPGSQSPPPAPVRLAGPGPYSVIEVDGLRDQLDDLNAAGNALRLSLNSLESDVRLAVQNRNEANAALNVQRDQSSRILAGGAAPLQLAQIELASLKAEIAGLEVLQVERERQRVQTRLTALDGPIDALKQEIARLRGHQQLDDATLARKLKELGGLERTLADERARLEERISQRQQRTDEGGSARNRELQSLNGALGTLQELQSLVRRQIVIWRRRHELLAGEPSAETRRALATAAASALDQLTSQQRSVADRQALLRIDMRAQANGPAGDGAARADEQRVQEAQQAYLAALQRLEELSRRTVVLLLRIRDDMAIPSAQDGEPAWFGRGWDRVTEVLGAIWQKEVFSATETTAVDGQLVTLDYSVTVGKSVGLIVLLIVGYWASGAVSRLIAQQLKRRLHVEAQFARVLQRWISSILMITVVLVVLRLARIPLTAFAFLGGALAIGVGFGTQTIIKNLISGVILLLERKIRVGDVITVGGMSGTVTTVDFRATTVRGFDGIDSIVPNSQLLENQISNWNGGGSDLRRMLDVGVAYGCDVRLAADRVIDCARANASVLTAPAPEVLLSDFGNDALMLRLIFWIRLGGEKGGPTIDSDLRFAIERSLREAGIAIAFPQRDVHLDLVGPVKVELAGAARPPAA